MFGQGSMGAGRHGFGLAEGEPGTVMGVECGPVSVSQTLHNIRSSKTMPTLHNYTRADIQEQYLATSVGRQAKVREQSGGDQAGSSRARKRAKSSEQQRDHQQQDQLQQQQQYQEQPSTKADWKRHSEVELHRHEGKSRRSHSASRLLTACFNIPHFLPGSSSNDSEPQACPAAKSHRSILAQLRSSIGQNHHHQHHHQQQQQQQQQQWSAGPQHQQRNEPNNRSDNSSNNNNNNNQDDISPPQLRPISASKTSSDLQQLASCARQGPKHVSFGHNRGAQLAQWATTGARQQVGPEQQRRPLDELSSARGNRNSDNVIQRNYQPAEHTTRALMKAISAQGESFFRFLLVFSQFEWRFSIGGTSKTFFLHGCNALARRKCVFSSWISLIIHQ